MRIYFEQSGGFVAGVNRPTVMIDTATLSAEEAEIWRDLVVAADFDSLPTNNFAEAARDAFSYKVTVESEGKQRSVESQSNSIPVALLPLIERLRKTGQSRVQ